jgi:hypothetical protein
MDKGVPGFITEVPYIMRFRFERSFLHTVGVRGSSPLSPDLSKDAYLKSP